MLDPGLNTTLHIGAEGDPNRRAHLFDEMDITAVNAAIAARRPLLLRGEPGVGKTQLAIAAAAALGYAYVHRVVDANTEARELRWSEDLVDRLSDAQRASFEASAGAKSYLDYVEPGPLWWGFDWGSAVEQSARRNSVEKAHAPTPAQPDPRCDPAKGVVVLIDEIDKAEPELPNSLLEALGSREFTVKERDGPVTATDWPLIIVTTNESRILPDAFLRRCLVHEMQLPESERLETFLVTRGLQHFPSANEEMVREIARQTVRDRKKAEDLGLSPKPGQAEFLDYLRAAVELDADDKLLQRMSAFFLKKHRELRR